MRLHLLCAVLALAILPVQSQGGEKKPEDQCQSFGLRSDNFYKVTKLRQFNNAFPQWVKFHNDGMYYNLNANTFKVTETQHEDMTVSTKIQAPYTNSVKDTNGNNIHQNDSGIFIYLDKNEKEFKVNIEEESLNNEYRFIMDPISQIVFVLSKTQNGNGPLYWLTIRRPGNLRDDIPTKKIAMFGQSITSMHFNDKTRNILLGAKVKRTGIVYLLEHSPNDPCLSSVDLEDLVLGYVNETYAAYQNAVLKKGGSDQRFTCPSVSVATRRKDAANERACTKLNNYIANQHTHLTSSVKKLIDANKELQKQLDEQKLTILDAVGKLNRLSQTAILNKGVPEPVFKEQLSPTNVEEYVAHKYTCVSIAEFEKGKAALDISPQLDYLKEAITMVKEDLSGAPKFEDLYGDIFTGPKGPESQSDLYGDIFTLSKGAEVQSDAAYTDAPFNINPSIDIRTKDDSN